MTVNPVLVGIFSTLFVEMAFIIIRDFIRKKKGTKHENGSKTF